MATPWIFLVSNGLRLLAATTELVSKTKTPKAVKGAKSELIVLQDRIAALESLQQADAEVLKQVSEQLQALTNASAALATKFRAVLLIAIMALAVAAVAIVISIAR